LSRVITPFASAARSSRRGYFRDCCTFMARVLQPNLCVCCKRLLCGSLVAHERGFPGSSRKAPISCRWFSFRAWRNSTCEATGATISRSSSFASNSWMELTSGANTRVESVTSCTSNTTQAVVTGLRGRRGHMDVRRLASMHFYPRVRCRALRLGWLLSGRLTTVAARYSNGISVKMLSL
jgi:hypothetical protein